MSIFLFFGEDAYSREKKLKFWREEFEKKYGGEVNISIFEGKNASAHEICQAAASLPFLADKRLTIVKDFLRDADDDDDDDDDNDERAKMADALESIPDFSVVVFSETKAPDRRTALFKRLHKLGKTVEFAPLTGSKLLAWIEKTAARFGGNIEKEAEIFLMELSNGDLYRLENEIRKLVAYAGGRPIGKADIELLMDTQLSASIFRLTDGVGQKNRRVSLHTLHQLMDNGEELHRILYMIMRQFRIIACVKDLSVSGMGREEMAHKLKEHPFVISNTLNQARNFSMDQLRRTYELLLDFDAKLKNGGIKIIAGDNREFVLALDRLVLDLCR